MTSSGMWALKVRYRHGRPVSSGLSFLHFQFQYLQSVSAEGCRQKSPMQNHRKGNAVPMAGYKSSRIGRGCLCRSNPLAASSRSECWGAGGVSIRKNESFQSQEKWGKLEITMHSSGKQAEDTCRTFGNLALQGCPGRPREGPAHRPSEGKKNRQLTLLQNLHTKAYWGLLLYIGEHEKSSAGSFTQRWGCRAWMPLIQAEKRYGISAVIVTAGFTERDGNGRNGFTASAMIIIIGKVVCVLLSVLP